MRWWVIGFVLGAACTKHNPEVCCTSAEDCASIGTNGGPYLCNNGLVCVDHVCGMPLMDASPQMPDASTMQCQTNTDCSGATPYCGPFHTCVGCTDSSQCPSQQPICDSTSFSCRGCSMDNECASAVCTTSGACADGTTVIYASPTGSDTALCTQIDPCSITHAFGLAGGTRNNVKLESGSYTANITLTNKLVNVYGSGATIMGPSGAHTFDVNDNAHLRIVGATIVNLNGTNAGMGIACEPTTVSPPPILDLDSVSIMATYATVVGNPCTATIVRSHLQQVSTGAIALFTSGSVATIDRTSMGGGDGLQALGPNAIVHVTNSIFVNVTGSDGAFIGGSAFGSAPGSMFVSFSTIVNSAVKCPSGIPACSGGNSSGACIDNSVIFNGANGAPADTVSGSACYANYTLVYPQSTALSGVNNKLGVNPLLVDPGNGDYHLQTTSPAIDAADVSATDANDFDGVARPQGPRSDLGAFEYKP